MPVLKNGDHRHFNIDTVRSPVLCATAFAAKTSKKTMHLYEKAKLEGKVLNPGDYKVEWSGTGPNIELNIVQGRDTLATVPARVVAENTSNEHDSYVLQPARNGGESIEDTPGQAKTRAREPVGPASRCVRLQLDLVCRAPNRYSFIAKGYERVSPRGAVRGDPTREKGNRREQTNDNREC